MADLTEAERREMRRLRRERITEENERQRRIEEQIQLLQQQRNEFILSQRQRRETVVPEESQTEEMDFSQEVLHRTLDEYVDTSMQDPYCSTTKEMNQQAQERRSSNVDRYTGSDKRESRHSYDDTGEKESYRSETTERTSIRRDHEMREGDRVHSVDSRYKRELDRWPFEPQTETRLEQERHTNGSRVERDIYSVEDRYRRGSDRGSFEPQKEERFRQERQIDEKKA